MEARLDFLRANAANDAATGAARGYSGAIASVDRHPA
jgi:hypothetical protein